MDSHNSANVIAETILQAFNKHYRIFTEITQNAKPRFINCDWQAERETSKYRITLYPQRVMEACEILRNDTDLSDYINSERQVDEAFWQNVKLCYISKLYEHKQPELAETFYNSVFTSVFHRRYYNNNNIFVRPSTSTEYLTSDSQPTYYSFYPLEAGIKTTVTSLLNSFNLGLPYENKDRDIRYLTNAFRQCITISDNTSEDTQIHAISSIFYRNKAAYIVGRVVSGQRCTAFAIALVNNTKGGFFIDAFIDQSKDINNLFSFARAYFMVDTPTPSAVVKFLHTILPHKTAADIYTAIGLQKQGKTEFYRDFLHHLTHSTDQLKISAGTKGMVMSVFTLPSYPFVFKVINDRFAPPKNVTQKVVKEKYMLVKMHDRVGRMADTLEFSHVALPLDRFSTELLQELEKKIPSKLKIENGFVIIRHLYIERRLKPLNLYLEAATPQKTEKAIVEYGHAIRDMAKANIFPGDMLLKNFGVTHHGRIIFYDYDEIELLRDVNFRVIPPPRFPEDEMAAEPWYSVERNDVFPEEFAQFIFYKKEHRKLFNQYHGELLTADYWRGMQEKIANNHFPDFFPYSKKARFNDEDQKD